MGTQVRMVLSGTRSSGFVFCARNIGPSCSHASKLTHHQPPAGHCSHLGTFYSLLLDKNELAHLRTVTQDGVGKLNARRAQGWAEKGALVSGVHAPVPLGYETVHRWQ